jgi:tetratricopeptide (TPR) repeat protein
MPDKDKMIAALDAALIDGYVFKVQELLEEAKIDFPNAAFLDFYQAEYHLMAWEYPQALEILERLVAAHPDNKRYLMRLAVAKIKNQDRAAGIDIFERLTEEYPDDADLFFSFGKEVAAVAWESDEVQKAINALSHVLVLDPNRTAVYTDRATALQNIGAFDRALADLDKVIELEPTNQNGYLRRIALNAFRENDDAVCRDYDYLIATYPTDVTHLYNYAQYCFKQEDYNKAISLLNEQVKIENGNNWAGTSAIAMRGEIYYAMQALDYALDDFNYVLKEDPSNSTVQKLRAQCYRDMGNETAFLADIAAALAESSFYKQELLILRADYFFDKGDYTAAQADYEQFLTDEDLSFHKKDGYFGLGKIAQANGNLGEAYEQWTLAKEHFHPDAEAYIENYCSDFLAQQAKAKDELIKREFAEAYIQNRQSPILAPLFGKTWKVEMDTTLEKSPAINDLPEGLVAFFTEAFRNIGLRIDENQFILENPAHGNIEAYYRIEKEDDTYVHIYGQPTGKQEARNLVLHKDGDFICVSGLMSGMTDDSKMIYIYFRQLKDGETISTESAEESEARIKKIAENFIGELLSTVVEGLESLGDIINPKGEAASDDIPPQQD